MAYSELDLEGALWTHSRRARQKQAPAQGSFVAASGGAVARRPAHRRFRLRVLDDRQDSRERFQQFERAFGPRAVEA